MGIVCFIFLLLFINLCESLAPQLLIRGSEFMARHSLLGIHCALNETKAMEISETGFQILAVAGILLLLLWIFGIFDLMKIQKEY